RAVELFFLLPYARIEQRKNALGKKQSALIETNRNLIRVFDATAVGFRLRNFNRLTGSQIIHSFFDVIARGFWVMEWIGFIINRAGINERGIFVDDEH